METPEILTWELPNYDFLLVNCQVATISKIFATIKNKELVNYNPTISQPATKIMEPWGTKIEPISD